MVRGESTKTKKCRVCHSRLDELVDSRTSNEICNHCQTRVMHPKFRRNIVLRMVVLAVLVLISMGVIIDAWVVIPYVSSWGVLLATVRIVLGTLSGIFFAFFFLRAFNTWKFLNSQSFV